MTSTFTSAYYWRAELVFTTDMSWWVSWSCAHCSRKLCDCVVGRTASTVVGWVGRWRYEHGREQILATWSEQLVFKRVERDGLQIVTITTSVWDLTEFWPIQSLFLGVLFHSTVFLITVVIISSMIIILANLKSHSRLLPYMLSPVCRLSVTFVHPTQAIEIFHNISMPFNTLAICRHPGKILRRLSQGNPSVGGVKHEG